jgi:hypothetical protein
MKRHYDKLILACLFVLMIGLTYGKDVVQTCSNNGKSCCCRANEQAIYQFSEEITSNEIDFQLFKTDLTTIEVQIRTMLNTSSTGTLSNTTLQDLQSLYDKVATIVERTHNINASLSTEINSLITFIDFTTLQINQIAIDAQTLLFSANVTMTVEYQLLLNAIQQTNNTINAMKQNLVSTSGNLQLNVQNTNTTCFTCCSGVASNITTLSSELNVLKPSVNAILNYTNDAIVLLNDLNSVLNNYICTKSVCNLLISGNVAIFTDNNFGTGIDSNITGDIYSNSFLSFQTGTYSGGLFSASGNPAMYADLMSHMNCAVSKTCETDLGVNISSPITLRQGVYCGDPTPSGSSVFTVSANIILDGQNLDNPVWIFNIQKTLEFAANVNISFINTPNPCNVLWIAGNGAPPLTYSAIIRSRAIVEGSLFSYGDVSLETDTTLTGRLFTTMGDYIVMYKSVINSRNCLGQCFDSGNIGGIFNSYIIQ